MFLIEHAPQSAPTIMPRKPVNWALWAKMLGGEHMLPDAGLERLIGSSVMCTGVELSPSVARP